MSPNQVKTSVIIPVYNTEEYLEACIESVLRQTQKDIEIILVDDGSTDGSSEIIKSYEKKYPFVKAVYQKNQKLGAARNAGVRTSSGKYIYFLDSDDYISENLLEKCYQTAEEKQLDFVMFDGKTFLDGDQSELRAGSTKEVYDRRNMQIGERIYNGIEFWNKFYSVGGVYPNAYLVYINAEFLVRNELFFEPGVYYEDNDWMVRMFFAAQRIYYLPQQLYFRRFHTGSIMTVNYNKIHLESCIVLCKKMINMLIDTSNVSMRKMITSILEMMLWRFREILIFCNEKDGLDSCQQELLEFYKILLITYKNSDIGEIGTHNIIAADIIKRELHKFRITIELPDLDLEEYKKDIITEECKKYELHSNGKVVGIYGTGLICDKFLALYEEYLVKFQASVFFIDTYVKTGEKYQGYPLYNIKDIGQIKMDVIIIASSRYKEVMERNIRDIFPELVGKIKVLHISKKIRGFM